MAKILVVDDEIGIRELLSDILSDEGYTVETAENAETARRLITTEPFDLILLDIWMPDTDGVSLLKELNVRHLLHCPVLMMSGHATIETAVEATKFGALDCLEKPISMQKLLQSVEHGLQVHERIQSMARYRPEEKKAPEVKLPEEPVMPIPEELPIFEIKGTGIVIDFNNSLREVRETTERAYLKALMNYENNQRRVLPAEPVWKERICTVNSRRSIFLFRAMPPTSLSQNCPKAQKTGNRRRVHPSDKSSSQC